MVEKSLFQLFGVVLLIVALPIWASSSIYANPVEGQAGKAANRIRIPSSGFILSPEEFKPYIDGFNAADQVTDPAIHSTISNASSWDFLKSNIPWFDCPDKQIEETYYYRWWTYRKHLQHTPDGWIVSEFLPDVPWAGKDNTISCAAGHHIYEGRWLRDKQYMADYARFWFREGGSPRLYSFWAADSVRALTLATGDKTLADDLLPDLITNHQEWEKSHQDANGLFQQIDDRDGMEYSLGGSGYRPTINAYMYGDAVAIAAMARDAGQVQVSDEYNQKALKIKKLVQTYLWNSNDRFFETAPQVSDLAQIRTSGVREEIGFVPWYFNLPDATYDDAWKSLKDPQGFAAPFGPTTVERRASGFMHPEDHDCLWNGPSWPYATTQTLVAMANLLHENRNSPVTKSDYFKLFVTYARSQQKDGRPWIAEDLDADTGKWIVDLPRSVFYNHSGFADLVITGLAGLRPRSDDKIVVAPLVPAGAWAWYCLDAIPYHGHSLTILYDETGAHYGKGQGLRIFVDGKLAAHRADQGILLAVLP